MDWDGVVRFGAVGVAWGEVLWWPFDIEFEISNSSQIPDFEFEISNSNSDFLTLNLKFQIQIQTF